MFGLLIAFGTGFVHGQRGPGTHEAGQGQESAQVEQSAPGISRQAGPRARPKSLPAADLAALAERLPANHRAVFNRVSEEFPGVNPTKVQPFHGMIADKRMSFGLDLTDETTATFREWVADVDALQRELVLLHAEDLGLSTGGIDEQGRGYALIGFEDGEPVYTVTTNVEAAISTGANLVRWSHDFDPALGPTVDGRDLYVSINDHGEIHEHTEFQLPAGAGSRIMVAETPWYDNANRNHMTHVAGTVTAWGYNSTLLGMAPRAWIRALIQQTTTHVTTYGMRYPGELHGAINPRTGEPQMKSVIGNTSLGTQDPNTRYTTLSRAFDLVLRDHPYYVHFYAASNDGSQFETLGGNQPIGKNVITIGAVQDVQRDAEGNYTGGGSIAGFSSRGPTYDGRIKPDFTANGVGVRSTTGTTGSSSYQGTSMASPNAAGSALLLIDYVHQRFPGHFFRSSTYKALLMNTADDRGNPGPDYTFGWGIVNVYAAGGIIRHHAENPHDRVLLEERLHPGQTWTYTYVSDGTEPIRASLAWLDVAGTAQAETSTDRTPRLVNDLDLRIVGPGGTVHQPYVLPFVTGQGSTPAFDANLRNAHATTGDNFTDPAEQVWIPAPAAGTYTVQVTHKGSLSGGQPQPFSLALSGLVSASAAPATLTAVLPNEGNGTNDFPMAVTGSGFALGSDVLLRRDGSPVVTGRRVIPVGDRIDFHVDTAGIDAGYYDVVVRAPDGTESILENGFLMPVAGGSSGVMTLYSNTFADADGLTLTGQWAVGAPNQSGVSGPGSAFSGSQVLGTYLNGNYENNIHIFATLPPFSTVNRSDIQLQFRRWLGLAFSQTGPQASRHRDDARIHYSFDGNTWTQLWASNGAFNESSWSQQTINLPAAAANRPQVFIRFQLETDGSSVSYGWNIDNLQITGVSDAGALLPPVFTSTPPATATQGEFFSYTVTTSDADTPAGDLILAATGLPTGLAFADNGDGTGLLSGTPTVSGSFEITLSVTDGAYTTWQIFELTIFPSGGNSPPVILTESLPPAVELQAYSATIEATDADGQPLTFSTGPLPAWLAFTDQGNGSATLEGTPPTGAASHEITVTVSDGFATTEATFTLEVQPRPLLALHAFTHAAEGVAPTYSAPGLQVSPAANGGGLNRFRTDEGGAVDTLSVVNDSARTDVAEAFAHSEFFTITLQPEPGEALQLHSVDFKVTRGGSSGTRNFALRSSIDPSVNLLGPKEPTAVRGSWDFEILDLSADPAFQNLTGPVTFYFIVATGSTSISLEFDDIAFTGTLTEQPEVLSAYDEWMAPFNGTVPEEQSGPEDSPMRDGYTNLMKFAFGLDPTVPAHAPTAGPWTDEVAEEGGVYLQFSFRRREGGTFHDGVYEVDGIRYHVLFSNDLHTWWPATALPEVVHGPDSGGIEWVDVRADEPLSADGPQFVRLVIEMP